MTPPQENQPAGQQPESVPLPAWKRKPMLTVGLLCAGLGLAIGQLPFAGLLSAQAENIKQRKGGYLAEAIIWVKVQRSAPNPPDNRPESEDDHLATHIVLIKSPKILSEAVAHAELAVLPSFKGTDPVAELHAGLSVTRVKDDSGKALPAMLKLAYRSPVAEDCPKVLAAVIQSYREFLDQTYYSQSPRYREHLERTRHDLQAELEQREKQHATLTREAPILLRQESRQNAPSEEAALMAVHARRAALRVKRAEIEGKLLAIESALANKRERGVMVRAAEWAARSGYDKLAKDAKQSEELVRDYGESLKQEREELLASENSLDRLYKEELDKTRKLNVFTREEERYMSDIASLKELYKITLQKLESANLSKEVGAGYELRIISPPARGK